MAHSIDELHNCPFCDGDQDGCCFCDHTGKVRVGKGHQFNTVEEMKPFQKEYPKLQDLKRLYDQGGFDYLNSKNK